MLFVTSLQNLQHIGSLRGVRRALHVYAKMSNVIHPLRFHVKFMLFTSILLLQV
jgi:hypothetical protein